LKFLKAIMIVAVFGQCFELRCLRPTQGDGDHGRGHDRLRKINPAPDCDTFKKVEKSIASL